ncbi:MAG TPA: hypothetical protein VIH59_27225 [Candidatus Tectomicrobia bacterium]
MVNHATVPPDDAGGSIAVIAAPAKPACRVDQGGHQHTGRRALY